MLAMAANTENKQERVNIRLKPQTKQVLERAASFEGKTVSDFILTTAMARAEKTIRDHEVMRLNAQDAETFINALSKPVRFNKMLLAALDEHEHRVTSK